MKVARTVLRGAGHSNVPGLPATCGAPPAVGPRVVDTAEPGVARSNECREGVTGGYRTHQETRNFRKHVSALCAGQTRNARCDAMSHAVSELPIGGSTDVMLSV